MADCAFQVNTCGGTKKAESTAIVTLPPSLCHPHLPTGRWDFSGRLGDSLWIRPGEEQRIRAGQKAWDRLLPVASPAGGNKLFTKGSGKPKEGKSIHKKKKSLWSGDILSQNCKKLQMQILWEQVFSLFACFCWWLTVVVFLRNYCCVLFSIVKTSFVIYTQERDLKVIEDRLFFKMSVQCPAAVKEANETFRIIRKGTWKMFSPWVPA